MSTLNKTERTGAGLAGSAAAQLGGAPGQPSARRGCCGRPGRSAVSWAPPCWPHQCCPGSAPSPSPSTPAAWPAFLLLVAAAVARYAGGPAILRIPTATQLAALAYLTIAVTALVFIAWYGALERLGVDRTGLFNGLIPVTSLAAVALTGTGTITPLGLLGALSVLAGVILGLSRAPQERVARWPQLSHPGPIVAGFVHADVTWRGTSPRTRGIGRTARRCAPRR